MTHAVLLFEAYLLILAVRKCRVNRETVRLLGKDNAFSVLAYTSILCFVVLVASVERRTRLLTMPSVTGGMVVSVLLFSTAPVRLHFLVCVAFTDMYTSTMQHFASWIEL